MSESYYYQIKFTDGRIIRREYISKKMATAVGIAIPEEMILFDVQEVSWGLMR